MSRNKFSFRSFFSLINQLHPQYIKLFVGILLGFISTGANLFVPQLAQKLINNFKSISLTLAILTVVIFIAGLITSALSGLLLGIFGENIVSKLRKQLWQKLLKMPVKYFDDVKTGEISSRLVNDTSQVKDLLASTLPNAMTSLLQFVGALVIMLAMDWRMTLLMFVAVPLVILVMLPVMNQSRKIGRVRQDELAKFASDSTDVLGEVRLVKSSNGEEHELAKGNRRIDNLYHVGRKEALINSVTQPITNMLMMIMFLGILGYGAIRVMNGAMTMGALVSFLMYLFQIISPVVVISQLFNNMAKTSGATERIQQILTEPEEFVADKDEKDIVSAPLKFENVDFAYEEGKPVLRDVSFETQPNAVVAFAGPSGGGKSTIFSLIERFYQPTGGKILIGEENIENVDLAKWREQIGLVSQDAAVMPGTIRDNLTYGLRREVSDEEFWDALRMAYADGFVSEMEDQLETEIGERGIKLSGGQRQRIAIARAFLRDPKILMLDEATASLDAESEAMVQKALGDLMQGRTTLVIAHRLSTIVDADKIYFIENGTVSGAGTHQELLKTTPLYAQYVKDQFK
ncbi:ABC transporter ATP-binding protein [Limosilactobacillus reuteri]|uniref:Multidrug resistance ABC transporter ATP-binding and permease protein n=1 Tax=Limosilactobacillus reuteri TaxID=1598 RepID=A0AAP2VZZ9_LIMRT|nr:ABC transporter ATP-binding protein [Limosilactobacillus reuteri]MCC4478460.1 ABC transporter ATP-binding protein/permease [Limosilactobacillus reuteri]MCC4481014.1 ABC transporter ATP-binding protein/permease [Limosilactobacillus reuteri]MCC4489270.1 ABC transporter ATP-binding protein/permease [Limosilactobacillus reuteri]MCC4493658.1 ABC transporter ATP-binding protein/permease [Limosilactobacillus reuteri]MCC4495717.1 ABC transporter ATP-binding protein/permease [Limosilactobacillus reu